MRPLIILIVADTTLLCSYVSGVDVKHREAYDRVAECISIGSHADNTEEKLSAATVICDAFKAAYDCMTKPFDSSPDFSTEVLDIFRAYHLELFLLVNTNNMCRTPLPYMKLKELVVKSGRIVNELVSFQEGGKPEFPEKTPPCKARTNNKLNLESGIWNLGHTGIMEKENLTSIENNEYVPCTGKINIRYYTISVNDWRAHSSYLRIFLDHVKCWDEESPKCDFPIQRYINAVLQAFGNHLKEHDPLGEMIKEIKQ